MLFKRRIFKGIWFRRVDIKIDRSDPNYSVCRQVGCLYISKDGGYTKGNLTCEICKKLRFMALDNLKNRSKVGVGRYIDDNYVYAPEKT